MGWVLGPALFPLLVDVWGLVRAAAAAPVTLWGLLDALWDFLLRKNKKKTQAIYIDINVVLRELEDLAVMNKHALRLSECAVKVWVLRRRSFLDWVKRERKPLFKVAESTLLMETHSSGLRWRVGMGVMGTALQDNNPLAVDVSQAWAKAYDRSEDSWKALPEASKFGLTHKEFLKVARPASSAQPLGPFVMAVPYYEGASPCGVVALDMDPKDAAAIKLGGEFDEADRRVTQLLYALAKGALGK